MKLTLRLKRAAPAIKSWKVLAIAALAIYCQSAFALRVKELAKVAGAREHALVGYGIVVGLSGSGDSSRNLATLTSISNTLSEFGVQLPAQSLTSRNVAGVMVTAKLNAYAEEGQALDVQVSSAGDARSLAGGTLLLTPLYGPDKKLYVMAQGPLSVGGFQFESELASSQKNYPTSGRIPAGGLVEQPLPIDSRTQSKLVSLLLDDADFTTAARVVAAVELALPGWRAKAIHAGRVDVQPTEGTDWVSAVARLEMVDVIPDQIARVVVSERTGTVVAGAEVRIAPVSITHGALRVDVRTELSGYGGSGLFIGDGNSNAPIIVPKQTMSVSEPPLETVNVATETSVADLVTALQALNVSSRDLISILQAMKQAGALRAELIIQ
jgi:flagellar P-ring protein FlgI